MHKAHAPHRNAQRPQQRQPQRNAQRHAQRQRQHQHPPQPQHEPLAPGTVVEGLLQFTDERSDGQLRDPVSPLKPVKGNLVVPRQTIRNLQLRPGLLLRGTASGKALNRIEAIEGQPPENYAAVELPPDEADERDFESFPEDGEKFNLATLKEMSISKLTNIAK
ncbi:MAG TPA: hypothetical protein VK324_05370, partial [Tepidisphaeraceae bacterium]|nr:hypothetical protein [Tepidisphaeraceae bacterium]